MSDESQPWHFSLIPFAFENHQLIEIPVSRFHSLTYGLGQYELAREVAEQLDREHKQQQFRGYLRTLEID